MKLKKKNLILVLSLQTIACEGNKRKSVVNAFCDKARVCYPVLDLAQCNDNFIAGYVSTDELEKAKDKECPELETWVINQLKQ